MRRRDSSRPAGRPKGACRWTGELLHLRVSMALAVRMTGGALQIFIVQSENRRRDCGQRLSRPPSVVCDASGAKRPQQIFAFAIAKAFEMQTLRSFASPFLDLGVDLRAAQKVCGANLCSEKSEKSGSRQRAFFGSSLRHDDDRFCARDGGLTAFFCASPRKFASRPSICRVGGDAQLFFKR